MTVELLWFLSTALPFSVLYQCTKLHIISFSCFGVMLQTRKSEQGPTDRQTVPLPYASHKGHETLQQGMSHKTLINTTPLTVTSCCD